MKHEEIINIDGTKTIKIYSTYSEAQKKATQKYRANNKEKVNEQRKKYYLNRKERDPNFLIYKREKAKQYYQQKKNKKVEPEKELHVVEIVVKEEPKVEEVKIIEHVNIDDTPIEKKAKRAYKKKSA